MIKKSKALALIGAIALFVSAIVPPQPSQADYAVVQKQLTITSTTVTPANGLTLLPLTGQSSCTVEIIGTATGTTQVLQNGTWTNVDSVQPSGTGAASATVSGPGTFIANCGGMQGYQFVPTSVTGSATVSVLANGGVSRILGAGVNGGRTIVAGTAPIVVTNAGNTATISLTDPLPILYGGTGATALPAGCLQSDGTVVTSIGSSCGAGAITGVTGVGNINVTAGATPVVSITNAPVFTGPLSALSLTGTGLTTGLCVQTTTGGLLTTAAGACGTGSGTVTAVTGSGNMIVSAGPTPNVTITNAPTFSGTVTANKVLTLAGVAGSTAIGFQTGTVNGDFPMAYISDNNNGTGSYTANGPNSGVTVSTVAGTCWTIASDNVAPTISNIFTLDCAGDEGILGAMHANSFVGAGSGLTGVVTGVTGTAPISVTAGATPVVSCSSCITGVTGTGIVSVTAGATPVVSVTNAPTFSGPLSASTLTGSGLTSGRCLQSSTGGLIVVTGGACATSGLLYANTTASFVIPAVGSSVAVSTNLASTVDPYIPVTISDGSVNVVSGVYNNAGTSFTTKAIILGSAGNTMGSGAWIYTGSETFGNGTVTSVSGTGNITSTGGTTPTVAITDSPTFAGTVTITGLSSNSKCLTSSATRVVATTGEPCQGDSISASFVIPAVGSTVSVGLNAPTYWPNFANTPIFITDGTNTMLGSVVSGQTTSTIVVENIGMLAGAVGNTMANAASVGPGGGPLPVAGSNIVVTTSSAIPTVATTNSPTYTGTVTANAFTANGSTANRCTRFSGTNGLASALYDCFPNTNATFTIPALGSTVVLPLSSPSIIGGYIGSPCYVTDGTNTMACQVTVNAASPTVRNVGMITGAVGNTMASGAAVEPGGGASLMLPIQGGTRINGVHTESSAAAGISVGTATTATFTYGTAFNAAPTCTVSTIGALAPTMSLNATPGTSSAVIYNSATAGTASIVCTGW